MSANSVVTLTIDIFLISMLATQVFLLGIHVGQLTTPYRTVYVAEGTDHWHALQDPACNGNPQR